ncbi:P-loop containing nucleoside triphosphate hydrolase protein [Chytridium lagenaria]|nr:P-loop containing nucleoside triphosphate hydrolase protein [Chytridium lagenaria]
MPSFDPLSIRTIEDDEEVEELDSKIPTSGLSSKRLLKLKAVDKKAAKKIKLSESASSDSKAGAVDVEVNPDFSFESDDDIGNAAGFDWDFSSAKAMAKDGTNGRTSVDDKIQRARQDTTLRELKLDGVSEEELEKTAKTATIKEKTTASNPAPIPDKKAKKMVELRSDSLEDTVREKRKADFFSSEPIVTEDTTDSFGEMRLSRPILKAISDLGYLKPTPIQSKGIPVALQGLDLCAAAVTGSGKTAAFMVPVLERLLFRPKGIAATRVLVLVPTRELGVQCHSVATKLAKYTDIQCCLAESELRKKPDVVIATPGRLIDHIQNSLSFTLDTVEILIIDEADRMLEDGFAAELDEIIKSTPKSRQTMLFSATMTDNVDDLIKLSLNKPVRLFLDKNTAIASKLTQEFIRVRSHREATKSAMLAALCARTYKEQCIVFFASKVAAHQMKIVFGLLGLKAAELHGNLTQLQRLESLNLFRERKVDFLLATDLAARGLDITGIKTVVNYDMPTSYSQYIHRVGRTARGSSAGRSVSFVAEGDRLILKQALRSSTEEVKHRVIPAEVIAKFHEAIKSLESSIKDILEEEKAEKEFQNAEMQVTRAENLIKYEDEIKSRPARTWFQTPQEKLDAKETLNKEKDDKPKRGKYDGLTRKKKRSKMLREEDQKAMKSQKVVARAAKRTQKPKRLQQFMKKK